MQVDFHGGKELEYSKYTRYFIKSKYSLTIASRNLLLITLLNMSDKAQIIKALLNKPYILFMHPAEPLTSKPWQGKSPGTAWGIGKAGRLSREGI